MPRCPLGLPDLRFANRRTRLNTLQAIIPTGMVMQPPCEVPLRTYQVVLRDEDVFADLTHNAAGEAV